ncbi:hypothetical protein PFLUV_G00049440 [Perca fluviatilis]|uniref:Uncharacterized protein n=1 Tax=Perca fluviatilis TaxID=8168 RepID=A0A6A5FAC4_PERFL|nr:hypothetical protein PFLUV_G00049440 [Perca fluviatilis]
MNPQYVRADLMTATSGDFDVFLHRPSSVGFLLERKPCTICALVFLAALFLICYSCWGNCFLYHCQDATLPDAAHDPAIIGT